MLLRRVVILGGIVAALSCFGGKKWVGEGHQCKAGMAGFDGDVLCTSNLICLPAGDGFCVRACRSDGTCEAGQVCAAGACVQPCDANTVDTCSHAVNSVIIVGVCCIPHAPGDARVCLPTATCRTWGSIPQDAGIWPDAAPEASDDAPADGGAE